MDRVAMKAGWVHSIRIVRRLPLDVARFQASLAYDVLMRLPMLAFAAAAATFTAAQFLKYEREVDPMLPDFLYAINVAMPLAIIAFLITIAATVIMRRRPTGKARGWEPRVTALTGTLLIYAVVFFPRRQLPFTAAILSTLLLLVGNIIAIYCLSHLGRSFSIMPEARELVTSGVYRYLRHPLYLAEMAGITGTVMQFWSVWTALILAVQIALQLRRMHNEEIVLTAVFPAYEEYKRRTARVLPGVY
jgi:protein-S-isoprenylcysteine O-methyltransferase Ste14